MGLATASTGQTPGILGMADSPTGVGVQGTAAAGRGGLFSGGAAQVSLVPSTAATHPTSGQVGDLFVDATRRLWFCKGGTTWVQLA